MIDDPEKLKREALDAMAEKAKETVSQEAESLKVKVKEEAEVAKVVFDEALVSLRRFFKLESAGGITLMGAMALALICANTPLASYYDMFLSTHLTIKVGDFGLDKPLLLWINDGLMAIFFLLVGLEIKREVLEGELSSAEQAVLPAIAAAGGIAVPAAIYAYFNAGDDIAMRGWAIPSATDIAFALGILALFGKRVPIALKIFLTAVAVIDDLAAIIIIAVFYTTNLSFMALFFSAVCVCGLLILNLMKYQRTAAYVLFGVVMWFAVLKSGVHATLAGVVLGLLIPHKVKTRHDKSMLTELEHDLHPWVAFMVLPVFAFANAGISFAGMTVDSLLAPIPLGIAVGLFAGKQIGVFGFGFIAIKTGLARLPEGINFRQFFAVCTLCGVGFTMSLFIGALAFETSEQEIQTRIGVLMGSGMSALLAALLLNWSLPSLQERQRQKRSAASQS